MNTRLTNEFTKNVCAQVWGMDDGQTDMRFGSIMDVVRALMEFENKLTRPLAVWYKIIDKLSQIDPRVDYQFPIQFKLYLIGMCSLKSHDLLAPQANEAMEVHILYPEVMRLLTVDLWHIHRIAPEGLLTKIQD